MGRETDKREGVYIGVGECAAIVSEDCLLSGATPFRDTSPADLPSVTAARMSPFTTLSDAASDVEIRDAESPPDPCRTVGGASAKCTDEKLEELRLPGNILSRSTACMIAGDISGVDAGDEAVRAGGESVSGPEPTRRPSPCPFAPCKCSSPPVPASPGASPC
jgi:hypothetical protein